MASPGGGRGGAQPGVCGGSERAGNGLRGGQVRRDPRDGLPDHRGGRGEARLQLDGGPEPRGSGLLLLPQQVGKKKNKTQQVGSLFFLYGSPRIAPSEMAQGGCPFLFLYFRRIGNLLCRTNFLLLFSSINLRLLFLWIISLPQPQNNKKKMSMSVPSGVRAGLEVFLVVRLPSTSICDLFERFPRGVFHPISVLTPPSSTPLQKMNVLFEKVCAGFEVFLVV